MKTENTSQGREGRFSQLEKGDLFTYDERYSGVVIGRSDKLPGKLITYLQAGKFGDNFEPSFHLVTESEWDQRLKASFRPYSENRPLADDLLGMARLVDVAFADCLPIIP